MSRIEVPAHWIRVLYPQQNSYLMTAEELKYGSDGFITEKCSQQLPGSKLIFSKASLTEFGCLHANVFMSFSEIYLITPLIGTIQCLLADS